MTKLQKEAKAERERRKERSGELQNVLKESTQKAVKEAKRVAELTRI